MAVDWKKIENKWQGEWEKAKLGQALVDKSQPKFMMIFAYPGISGFLHVGHMRGFSYTDAICRFKRLKGYNVLFPVGTHASGNQAFSFANKIKNKDPDWTDYLLNNGCPKKELKNLEEPPKVIDYFNQVYVNDYWKKFGFLCDWERFVCTTSPDYEKFIQWQFKKLKEQDLLVQKPYFATACINCGPVAVDPSETDISKGGNAEKIEYTLLKFKIGPDYLVAATLRPETIYGQTNLWINPSGEYVRVKIGKEYWIMSREAAEKIVYQKEKAVIKEKVPVKNLLGKLALAPGINRQLIILPSEFCDPKVGTGAVTCVPSDAPYDYVALEQLKKNPDLLNQFGISLDTVKKLLPIPIIKIKGYSDFPAKDIIEKMRITSLADKEKLEEATAEVYKAGYHQGIMSCSKFAGRKVEEAKELMKEELLSSGKADLFYDLSEEVVCRCGNKVVIKRIDDQWFIRYSDEKLTEKSKQHLAKMDIYPEEYLQNLPGILDWFKDRACTRLGNWMGSKFPFDEKWTIEPISDSTLYPAYYIVARFVNSKKLAVSDLTEPFFDYVYLGKGRPLKPIWQEVRKEFEYFYPLDLNLGGKEHKTVHFPVFLMNHLAILPENKWPQGIFVNWWVTGKGSKISKSKGGAVPIPEAIEKYGVDAMRLYYAHISSPHIDVVWAEEAVYNYKNTLERIYNLVEELKGIKGKKSLVDGWLLSKMNSHLEKADEAMKKYDLRELATLVYYQVYDDLKWYLRRGGNNHLILKPVINSWSILMNPITPHLSEELGQGLVSNSSWPKTDLTKINPAAEFGEELVKETIEGMRKVLELSKISRPKKFTLFIAEEWRYSLFKAVKVKINTTHHFGEIMKRLLAEKEFKAKGQEISKIVPMLLKDTSKLPKVVLSQKEESAVMNSAKKFLEKEFNCAVEILSAEKSTDSKAKGSMPGKVGILVE